MDFTPFFEKYEALVAEVDRIFDQVQSQYSENVSCGKGCDDCCYALFDLSLIEAMYLNHQFNKKFEDARLRDPILERADAADRQSYKLKRRLFKAAQGGTSTAEIMAEVAKAKVRCPLLADGRTCELYEHRPVTCRLYGIPTAIGGTAHTCGNSSFAEGKEYPTVNMDAIQDKLVELSYEFVSSIPTSHQDLHTVFVPVSMALLTRYDTRYLGLPDGCASCGHTWEIGGADGENKSGPASCTSCPTAGAIAQSLHEAPEED